MADPQKYRDEAKRLRLQSLAVNDADLRGQMLDIAAQYERMAVSLAAMQKNSLERGF